MAVNGWDVVSETSQDEWDVVSEEATGDSQWDVVGEVAHDTFVEGVGKVVENTPARMKLAAGGLTQAFADKTVPGEAEVIQMANDAKRGDDPSLWDQAGAAISIGMGLPSHMLRESVPDDSLLGQGLDKVSEFGRDIADDASAELATNQPNVQGEIGQFGIDVTRAVIDMVPAITAGVATKNPGTTLGIMAGQVGGHTYDEYIKEGRTPSEAMAAAKFKALAEVIPESIPVAAILKRGTPLAKRLFDATLGEGAQEFITSVLGQSYDNRVLEDMSLKEAIAGVDWTQAGYEGLVGVGVGGTLAAATHPFVKGDDPTETVPVIPDDLATGLSGPQALPPAETAQDGFVVDSEGNVRPELQSETVDRARTQAEGEGRFRDDVSNGNFGSPALGLPAPENVDGEFVAGSDGVRPTLLSEVKDRAHSEAEAEKPYHVDFESPVNEGLAPRGPLSAAVDAYGPTGGLTIEQVNDVPEGGFENGIDFSDIPDAQKPEKVPALDATVETTRDADRRVAQDKRLETLAEQTKDIKVPEGFDDPRLSRLEHRDRLGQMAETLVEGGNVSLVPDQNYQPGESDKPGEVPMVRTPSANPEWFQSMNEDTDLKMSVKDTQKAIKKALAGEKLGIRQTRVVSAMLGEIEGQRTSLPEMDVARQKLDENREKTVRSRRGLPPLDAYNDSAWGEQFEESEYDADASAEARTMAELADVASQVDESLTHYILEQHSIKEWADADTSALLWEIINDGQTETADQTGREPATVRPSEAEGESSPGQTTETPTAEEITAALESFRAHHQSSEAKNAERFNSMMEGLRAEGWSKDGPPGSQTSTPQTQTPEPVSGVSVSEHPKQGALKEKIQSKKGYVPPASKKPQTDMFGTDDNAQAVHDKKETRKAKERNAPEMHEGAGDLFSDKSKQTDIEDSTTNSVETGSKLVSEKTIDEAAAEAALSPKPDKQKALKNKASNKSTAPEHQNIGVEDRELGEIVEEFNDAQESMVEGDADYKITHVFDAPKKKDIVRLDKKAGVTSSIEEKNGKRMRVYHRDAGWMTVEEAKNKIDEWENNAVKQGQNSSNGNGDRVVISLFDLTGSWSMPWEQAGYQVYRFDIQSEEKNTVYDEKTGEEVEVNIGDINEHSFNMYEEIYGMFEGKDVYAVLAACPCTDFAVSGARHFAAKDTDGRTVASVKLVHQTLNVIEYFKPVTWALENPVGRIEKLGGLPPWRLSFDPYLLGEDYTKKTLIWGRFNADLPVAPTEPTEGSKMHQKYGGKSMATKNARSATPEGFSYSFFMANNAIDNPVMAVANKYDRLDGGLIKQAVDLGITEKEIDEAVEDFYYQDLDDEGANTAISELISDKKADATKRVPEPDKKKTFKVKASPKKLPEQNKPTEPAPPADPYLSLNGKKLSYDVMIEDTGEVMTVTEDAGQVMRAIDQRIDSVQALLGCLKK